MNKSIKTIMALSILLGAPAPVSVFAEENIETNNDVVEVVREHIPNPGFSEIVEVDPSSAEWIDTNWENNEKPAGWLYRYGDMVGPTTSTLSEVNNGEVKVKTALKSPGYGSLIPEERIDVASIDGTSSEIEYYFEYKYKELKSSSNTSLSFRSLGYNSELELCESHYEIALPQADEWTPITMSATYDEKSGCESYKPEFYIKMGAARVPELEVRNLSMKTKITVLSVNTPEQINVLEGDDLPNIENLINITGTENYDLDIDTSNVDTSKPGDYIVKVTATDLRAGATHPMNEQYRVVEKEIKVTVDMKLIPLEPGTPIIQVATPEQINVLEGDDLPNIEDLVDVTNSENYEIAIDSSNVDTSKPGKYIVKVTVTDTDTNIVVNKEIVVIVDMKLIPLEPGTPTIPLTPLEPATPIEPEVPLTPIEPSTPIVPEQPIAPTVPETPGETPSVTGPVVEIPTEQLIDELPQTGVASGSLSAIGSVTSLLGALFIMLKRKQ